MKYIKKKFGDEDNTPISFWSTDDNITCEDGKTLRENLSDIDTQCKDIANEIENLVITGGGLSSTAKTLLISILQNAIYTTDQSANITALESALTSSSEGGGDTPTINYTIVNNLSNCINSNTNTTIEKNSSYVATLTANEGYALDIVTITMNGEDITSTAYSEGNINIVSVTGDIIITASATEESTGTTFVYDSSKWVQGQKPDPMTGEMVETSTYAYYNEHIDLTDISSITCKATKALIFLGYFYNDNDEILPGNQQTVYLNSNTNYTGTLSSFPDGATYVILSVGQGTGLYEVITSLEVV